jgi:hypothetical protein
MRGIEAESSNPNRLIWNQNYPATMQWNALSQRPARDRALDQFISLTFGKWRTFFSPRLARFMSTGATERDQTRCSRNFRNPYFTGLK